MARLTGAVSRAADVPEMHGDVHLDTISAVSGWTCTLVATAGGYAVRVTGAAGATVKWMADMRVVEVRS